MSAVQLSIVSGLLTYPIHWEQIRRLAHSWPGAVTLVDIGKPVVDPVHLAHGESNYNDVVTWQRRPRIVKTKSIRELVMWYIAQQRQGPSVVWHLGEPTDRHFLALCLIAVVDRRLEVWSSVCENEFVAKLRHLRVPKRLLKRASYGYCWQFASGWLGTARAAITAAELVSGVRLPSASLIGASRDLGGRINHKRTPERVHLCFVGRLVEEKGVFDLLDALTHCDKRYTLTYVGVGSDASRLARRVDELHLQDRVCFTGLMGASGLAELFRDVDILVCASRSRAEWREQFGLAVIEAMSACITPIVSDSGSLPEVVGPAGVVVREGDIAELARAISTLGEDLKRRAVLGLAGRHRFEALYSFDAVSSRILRVLRQSGDRQCDEDCI